MRKIALALFILVVIQLSFGAFTLKWFYALAPSDTARPFNYDRMVYGATAAIAQLPGVNSVGGEPDDWLEIVFGSEELRNYEDTTDTSRGLWRCLDATGRLEWFKGTQTDESRSSPAILDFYGGDGLPDIIGGTTSGWNVEAMDRFGNFLWTFPSPPVLSGPYAWHSSPAVADFVPALPGLEVVIGCNAYNAITGTSHWGIWCFQADPSDRRDNGITSPGWLDYPASVAPGGTDGIDWDVIWYRQTNAPVISTPCAADMNGDGADDVIIGVGWHAPATAPVGADDGKIMCLNGTNGAVLWSVSTGDHVTASPAVADLDRDGDPEVVVGSYDGNLYFIDGDENGNGIIDPSEMEVYRGSGRIYSSAAIADVDHDGDYEIVVGLGNGLLGCFNYFPVLDSIIVKWVDTLGDSIVTSPAIAGHPDDRIPWPFFRRDAKRTGFYPYAGPWLHIFIAADKPSGAYLFDILGDGSKVDSVRIGKTVFASPVVADIDKDCNLDLVITGANYDTGWIFTIDGPDTFFCFETGITTRGCEDSILYAHITDVWAEGCSLVYATVCVYDEDSFYVHGLQLRNFNFTENGAPIIPPRLRMLNVCPPETHLVDIVFLFDFSTSMDSEITLLHLHVPEFVHALKRVDYRIAMIVFNGCPSEPSGVCKLVRTAFTGPRRCILDLTAGPDWWASDSAEFECLFRAAMTMYTWPPGTRGSGYEDQYGAIYRANSWLTFRPGAKKIFVLLTDERPIVRSTWCSPAWGPDSASLDSIIEFCRRESITVLPITPRDGEFEYVPGLEPAARRFYTGYYDLAESTGGEWFYLYSADWTVLVRSVGHEIANDSCCYLFVWPESIFCEDSIHLEVTVVNDSGAFGVDDTYYISLCPPDLKLVYPFPCGGVTTCEKQGFKYIVTNKIYGPLVPSTLVLIVNGDTLGASDPRVSVDDTSITFTPTTSWDHHDTVVFYVAHVENMNGCVASTPPCTFYVDLMPPAVIRTQPADAETMWIIDEFRIGAQLFDDFCGVDTSLVGSDNVVVLYEGDTLGFDSVHFEDSMWLFIDGLDSLAEGNYTVCILNLYDNPDYDYCPPNHMPRYCWNFYLSSSVSHIWFGDTAFAPCETAYVPLYIDSVGGAGLYSLDLWFRLNSHVMYPTGLDFRGCIARVSAGTLLSVVAGDRWYIHVEFAETVTHIDTGIVLWLKGLVNCRGHGGDYTSIIIDSARAGRGLPRLTWSHGFLIVLWRVNPWLQYIIVDRVGSASRRTLTIGGDFSATDLYDTWLDLLYLEPPPAEVDAFITMNDPSHPSVTKLSRSVQDLSPPNRWVIKTDSETLTTVHWNPIHFPDGHFELNGVLDMKRETLFVWNTSIDESLVITWSLPRPRKSDVTLVRGWNLISLPAIPTHHSPREVFPWSLGIWTYNAQTKMFYIPDLLDMGRGYWVYSTKDTSYPIAGIPVTGYCRHVYRGWNLIGGISSPVALSNVCTVPSTALIPPLYRYSTSTGSFQSVTDSLYPGVGYWALFASDAILSVPSGRGYCRLSAPPKPDWMATIEALCDGEPSRLYFGTCAYASDDLDPADEGLPPVLPQINSEPPVMYFVRDGIMLKKDISRKQVWNLILSRACDVKFEIPQGVSLVLVMPNGSLFELSGVRRLRLNAGEYKIASPDFADLPKFTLLSCKPNPFNEATTIIFGLPRRMSVLVAVYDISGRLVRKLVHDKLEPGYHKLIWRPDNGVSSGVYFIELQTPDGTIYKRVLLVK